MSLISMSVHRPVLVAMLVIGLAGIGLFCYLQLPREMFPEVEFPVVTVVTSYLGAGPEEVEQLITKELEDEVSTVEGIKHLRGTSQQGLSLVIAEFYLDIDIDTATADVRDKVNVVRNALPEGADDPIVQKFDFGAQPVMWVAVSAPRSVREVYEMADERIKDRLSGVPGVASVEILGGEEREIHVLADQQRLRACGLSITDLAAAVGAANLETPGGQIQQNSREYNIRLRGKFSDLDAIRNLRIVVPGAKTVYLREVAEVRDFHKDIRDIVRSDGKTCVALSVQKRSDGNTVKVDAAVREQIKKLREILPADFEIRIMQEQASWITSSINNVFENMIIGIVLTAVALFLFLHTFRSVLIISLTMPISVVLTFILMYASGVTLNVMSLMGLAMTIGVLVNNAILVLENIVRYVQLDHPPDQAAIEGTSEIAIAVASTTLTNVVVFVPIAFMGGIIGQFFKDFGLTATIATVVSLFVSFTLAPTLAARLIRKAQVVAPDPAGQAGFFRSIRESLDRFAAWFDGVLENLKGLYGQGLGWCLRHRVVIVVGVLVLLFSAFALVGAGFIGAEFITPMDQGQFIISLEMPTGTRLEETDAAVSKLEAVVSDLNNLPEFESYFATVGRIIGGEGAGGGGGQSVNRGQISMTLVDKDKRDDSTATIMNRLRPALAAANIPGAKIKLLESQEGGEGAPIQMEIVGPDTERCRQFAERAMVIISNPELVPGAIDVDTNYRLGQPEIRVIPDREKCRDIGIDSEFLAQVIRGAFDGLVVGEYRDGAYNYDIRVRNDEGSRRTVDDIGKLTVMNHEGRLVPLPQVARIVSTTGPSELFRKDRLSLVTVSCDSSGRSQGEVASNIRRRMAPLLEEFSDCNIFFGGEIEMMEESFGRLFTALIMAVCLTYILLASLLESFTQPLIIMFSLPLSLIGVFYALFLMGGTFSIFSIMSIVMLVGLVINNSIIVIDYINHLRQRGKERTAAILEAGTTRLRPILMANLTTVVALIPLALGRGWGGEMMAPMAMVQIGGLIAGGGMGLLIVPVIYTISDDFNSAVKRLLGFNKKRVDA